MDTALAQRGQKSGVESLTDAAPFVPAFEIDSRLSRVAVGAPFPPLSRIRVADDRAINLRDQPWQAQALSLRHTACHDLGRYRLLFKRDDRVLDVIVIDARQRF